MEKLAKKMDCTIEGSPPAAAANSNDGIFFYKDQLVEIVRAEVEVRASSSTGKHAMCRKPLQSVKEEDDEDDDIKSDHLYHKRLKLK